MGNLEINAVEDIFLIATIVHHNEFRRIQKPAGVQSVGGNEVAPVFAAVSRD